jgi:hypothetical protein
MYIRVATPGQRAFQLRAGEQGISVFDRERVEPALADDEVLAAFRDGSIVISCTKEEIEQKGLVLVATLGDESLPDRLRLAHAEIRPSETMTRAQFKAALKELE